MVAGTGEDLLEGASELPAEPAVYQGVQHRVHMAEPRENSEDEILVGETVLAGDDQDVEDEEGRPAGDEATDDDAEGPRGTLLLHVLHQMPRSLLHRLLPPGESESPPSAAVHRRRPLTTPLVVDDVDRL